MLSQINVLPAGSDVHHPDVPVSHPHAPATVQINPPPVPEPHVSDSAPKPAPAPHKGEIHIPQSGAEFEKKEKEVKKEVKETADQAEKKGKEVKEQAEQKGKEVKDKAEKLASKAEKKTEELADKAEKKTKELAKKAQNELKAAESKLGPYWERTKDIVLRPGTLGGLMGVGRSCEDSADKSTSGFSGQLDTMPTRQRTSTALGTGESSLLRLPGPWPCSLPRGKFDIDSADQIRCRVVPVN